MAQKLPKMAQNYPKWPKYDARIYALFPQFFLTEKAVPQTFSLLECMGCLYYEPRQQFFDWMDGKEEIHSYLRGSILQAALESIDTRVEEAYTFFKGNPCSTNMVTKLPT